MGVKFNQILWRFHIFNRNWPEMRKNSFFRFLANNITVIFVTFLIINSSIHCFFCFFLSSQYRLAFWSIFGCKCASSGSSVSNSRNMSSMWFFFGLENFFFNLKKNFFFWISFYLFFSLFFLFSRLKLTENFGFPAEKNQ